MLRHINLLAEDEGGWSKASIKSVIKAGDALAAEGYTHWVLYDEEESFRAVKLTLARYDSADDASYKSWVLLTRISGRRAAARG